MDADWNADMAADPPRVVLTENGRATVSRALWEESDVLGDLQREADSHRNLHPELEGDQ
ncbi:hypothetical protein G6030_01640 [Dietzia sp. E1]|uniref:hypothetical protein n=1 Tax=Dietzia sp. E1 TaxID=328361 RepID=UPI0015FD7EAF|nr:hypothetical protein [Dietzia sp. E1]MBB1020015.1 hypothetical protein [Dietzia sp. E1]